ncbi:MAG: hypothetical protein H0X33_01805 [Taibaiella sp.]|nr:hypothetical protein [Taibaiella sp.]
MKKTLFILLAIFATANIVTAQPHIEYSQAIDEPEVGFNKVLQLQNGNTFHLHFTKKEGIDVTVFDKSHNIISKKTITSDLWDPKKMLSSTVEGLYEISSQPVIFLHQTIEHTPSLYRIVLDPNTGELLKEKMIGSIEKDKVRFILSGGGIGIGYGAAEASDFYVEKDPASDCYAIAYLDGTTKETNEKIKVVHYSGKHRKISTGYYDSPEGKFNYLRFIGMTVIGEKYVHLCTYGYNSKKDNGEDARVIVSKLKAGDSVFTHKMLDFSEDFRNTRAVMKYNPGTNVIQLLTLTYLKSKRKSSFYLPVITYIDPETLFITASLPLTAAKASDYIQSHLDREEGFQGLPQDMIINKDNTSTVLLEETQQQITYDRNGAVTRAETTLGNIGLTELDNKGKEKEGYAILKSQYAAGLMQPLYIAQKSKGLWSYTGRGGLFTQANSNAFMSYDYVSTYKNRYVIFNDLPVNFDRDEKKKRKKVLMASSTNTVCYKLNKGEMEKFYLFGESDDKQNKFCYIEGSSYMKSNNTYATMMIERNGRDKQAKMVWITFE